MLSYRERLHVLLEEERSQNRKSWQLEMIELEEQQQQLQEAEQEATKVLSETDTSLFIQR